MKIIGVSNLDEDIVSDILIAENVPAYWGERIVALLREKMHGEETYIAQLVPDDHKLYKWEP